MLGQINKTLSKQINHLKHSLSQNQHHSLQDIFTIIDQMHLSLQDSYKNIIQHSQKKNMQSKNQLKKQNQLLNHYHTATDNKEQQIIQQNQNLKEQIHKNKMKIQQLLKTSQKYLIPEQIHSTNSLQTKGTQCELKDNKLEQILEDLKKQNIFLNMKIMELQQTIIENQENIDSANVLIKELIQQLETNISDRETWSDASSERSSLKNSSRFEQDLEQSAIFSHNSYQMSQSNTNCAGQASGEDNSTIDGSNTTHRDFALPEWLEFDEPIPFSQNKKYHSVQQEDLQIMWPQLLINRCKQFFGELLIFFI